MVKRPRRRMDCSAAAATKAAAPRASPSASGKRWMSVKAVTVAADAQPGVVALGEQGVGGVGAP